MVYAENTWLSNEEYLMEFNKKSAQLRIPLSGSLALTHRCNLSCVHCYIRDHSNNMLHKEMSAKKILSLIDEITEAGCLHFLITGGDPLLREDFSEIYSRAKRNGLLVTVFTNGTLITDRILELFENLPPRAVEISLYGATASTYEKITGVPGSYEKCVNGIRLLLDHKIYLRLKTVLMTYNNQEFYEIENMAKDYGVKFRFDAAIFPRFNGDKSALSLRVSPQEAIEKEFSDEYRARQWEKYFKRTQGQLLSNNLYNCGAGVTCFHIDPYGNLQPCLMTTNIKYNLLKSSFLTGWRNIVSGISDKKAGKTFSCNQCEKLHLCGVCPAFFELENGSEYILSEYLCALGNYRFQLIHNENLLRVS